MLPNSPSWTNGLFFNRINCLSLELLLVLQLPNCLYNQPAKHLLIVLHLEGGHALGNINGETITFPPSKCIL